MIELYELYIRATPVGLVTVIPLTYGRARVTISFRDPMQYDDLW